MTHSFEAISLSESNPAILVQQLSLGGTGPTVVVKDCIDVAGYRTQCGSRAFSDAAPADRHAAVVATLLAHGCRLVGKANMHELAFGITGINGFTGTPRNYRYPDRIPGGSSSGSAAAVSAGLCDFAIGTDTGGSIRMPAICCGVYGLKPTFGRISREGARPANSSLDCIGPFGRDLRSIERAMEMIAPRFAARTVTRTGTLGVVETESDPTIQKTVHSVLLASDFQLRSVKLPSMQEAFNAGMAIISAEMFESFAQLCGTGVLGKDVETRLYAAREVSVDRRKEAEEVRHRFKKEVDDLLREVDALALPVLPMIPPTLKEAENPLSLLRLTELIRPFNLSGHPALAIPVETADGLPAGIQLIGQMWKDEELCAIGSGVLEALK